ncbi:DUF4189 domain-containing protein [Acidisphaera sp. L21]|uniref:DUF4189 domain-containing protein n=1 Tax=Acidisphaera sp. L21 TaxID=1641851 RepID=UPI00131C7080|nr:DUF4189 domain-containing protein [Acidisphaera sp. L21]
MLLLWRTLGLQNVIVGAILAIATTSAMAEGAIAQSDDGRFGLSYNHSSAETADDVALSGCGADCKIVEHFHAACAAIARNRLGGFGYGVKPYEGQAQHEAYSVCERKHQGCGLYLSGCDKGGD